MREISLCNGWEFTASYSDAFLNGEGAAEPVRLPHTCKELPLHYADEQMYQMLCGYRKTLEIPAAYKGKRLFLRLDGAGHEATVFVNGKEAGCHHCGYTAFSVELTDLVEYGAENRIVVRLDTHERLNQPPFGYVIDYMTFGGLYREVWLELREPAHVADVFLRTPDLNTLLVDLQLAQPELVCHADISVSHAEGVIYEQRMTSAELSETVKEKSISIPSAKPWSPESPTLYTFAIKLYDCDNTLLDERQERFGFRCCEFRADGFYLNGARYKIRGLNRHQSFPYVGYAMPASMQREDARILKQELQVNAVRTSHYPQSQAFLGACDELGLLVFTEIPGWQHIGDNEHWKQIACDNTRDMVLQNRNHVSIILWGVRINESQDDDALYERTNEIARRLDPSRQTSGVRFIWRSNLLEDVYTFNDFSHIGSNGALLPRWLISKGKDKGYLIGEFNGAMFPIKSFDAPLMLMDQALRYANVLDRVEGDDRIAGAFGWCMFDYYTHGDFGSGDRICYHGVMDSFRNPKLAAAVYAACGDDAPVLELSSSMLIGDYPASSLGDTYLISNADSVRFYKNDQFVKDFPIRSKRWKHLKHPPILLDDTIGDALKDGEGYSEKKAEALKKTFMAVQRYGLKIPVREVLKAVWRILCHRVSPVTAVRLYNTYIESWGTAALEYRFDAVKNGEVVATVRRSAGADLRLSERCSHNRLVEAQSYDVAAVRLKIVDGCGSCARYAQLPLSLRTEGPIEVIGPSVITAEGGMCGVYVKSTGEAGKATLYVSNPQLPELEIPFEVVLEQ